MRCLVLAALLTACVSYSAPPGPDAGGPDAAVGGGSGDPLPPVDANNVQPGNPAARAAFAQDVWPIQRDVCGFFCHSGIDAPDFVDILDADDSYAAMLQYPALLGDYSDNAPVATYSHLPASNAKVFTTLQLSVVRNWLRLERGD